jgi:RNA polymerase sigma-70 factor (ECF subfamily)
MANQLRAREDAALHRLRQAFADEEPTTQLSEVVGRAASYQAAADLQAAVHRLTRDPAPVSMRVGVPAVPWWPPRGFEPAPISHELTTGDLVAARRRDSDALARIYQAYAPLLFRFFVAALGDRHAAEDLTGSVFAGAIADLPGFRGPVEALGGWLFRIARHDLYDHRRKEARTRTENLDDVLDEAARAVGAPDPQELVVQRLEGTRVLAALERLSADQREVLLLRIAAGLTAPQVAAALGKTTGAVKALQDRALTSLASLHGHTHGDQRPSSSPDPPRSTNPQQQPEEPLPS